MPMRLETEAIIKHLGLNVFNGAQRLERLERLEPERSDYVAMRRKIM